MIYNVIIITDTSCLIVLSKIGAIEFLPQLFSQIVVTDTIASEYRLPLPSWIEIVNSYNKDLSNTYSQQVDAGEASAIALALSIKNPLLVLDDMKGRKLARKLSLPVIGTIGILIKLRENGQITSLRPYFEQIISTNFRIDSAPLDQLLNEFSD